MFKGPSGFGNFINAGMNLIIGIAVGVFITLSQGAPLTFPGLLQSLLLSFGVGYTCGSIFPLMDVSSGIAKKLHLQGVAEYIVTAAILGFCMAVLILFFVAFINIVVVGGMGAVMGFFIQYVPYVILIAVVIVIALLKPFMALAAKVSKFNPAEATMA